jgi:hypothetical protein
VFRQGASLTEKGSLTYLYNIKRKLEKKSWFGFIVLVQWRGDRSISSLRFPPHQTGWVRKQIWIQIITRYWLERIWRGIPTYFQNLMWVTGVVGLPAHKRFEKVWWGGSVWNETVMYRIWYHLWISLYYWSKH